MMLKIFTVLAALAGPISCLTVSVPVHFMNTTVGENITLVCTYTISTTPTNLQIEWSFYHHTRLVPSLHPPCYYMDEKSISHCRKTVYMTDARGRCSWRNKDIYFGHENGYGTDVWVFPVVVAVKKKEQVSSKIIKMLEQEVVAAASMYLQSQCCSSCQRLAGVSCDTPFQPDTWGNPASTLACYATARRQASRDESQIYYSSGGQTVSYGEFKGRIQGMNGTGIASIKIFNMQPLDTGVYICEVFTPAEGQVSNHVAISVLAPPSQMQCGVSTTAENSHNFALTCSSKIGLPSPTYLWYKVSGDTIKPVTETYNNQTGLFVIGNLTSFEEGYYQCMAINSLGNSTCQTDVTIKHSDSGIIVGALVGAILAAALICGVVWFFTSKEKKKKEKIAASGMQAAEHKEPLSSEYASVPNQEVVPVASAPPSKESNEMHEYETPEESEVATEPENQIQIIEHQPVA